MTTLVTKNINKVPLFQEFICKLVLMWLAHVWLLSLEAWFRPVWKEKRVYFTLNADNEQ